MVKNKKEETVDKAKEQDLVVDCASEDSFPASDPPAWTGITAKVQCEDAKDKK